MPDPSVKTVLQLAHIDETGDSYYRMRWPARELARQNPDWRVINLSANASERFAWGEQADLLVLFQSNDMDLIPVIRARKKRGLKTLVEYNDNFYDTPAAAPVARAWSSPLIWQAYERMMREADGLIVTCPALANLFAGKSLRPAVVLENLLPEAPAPFESNWREPGPDINLGWAGSLGHMADFLAIVPVLQRLLGKYPGLKLHLMGNRAIPGMLNMPKGRVFFTEFSGMHEYMAFWKPVQIGLAAMLNTEYNRCRSDVKALEMAASSVLPVLPGLPPYQAFIKSAGLDSWKNLTELEALLERYMSQTAALAGQARRAWQSCQSRVESAQHARSDLYRAHLPAGQPASFKWPCESGYHEIAGTAEKQGRRQIIMSAMEQHLKNKDPGKALDGVRPELDRHPDDPDLLLAFIHCASRTGKQDLAETATRGAKLYPADLRFELALAQLDKTGGPVSLWQSVVRKLEQGREAYREFFAAPVLRVFGPAFRGNSELVDCARRLLRLYPSSLILLFEFAGFHQRSGETKKALEYFEKLDYLQRQHSLLQSCGAAFDWGYVETWIAALRAGG